MKVLSTLIFGLTFSLCSLAQSPEFKTYSNGLIYSEETMTKLSFIVDSLNLKFKTCDFNKDFYSVQQVMGHYIYLDSGDLKSAKKDIDQNISFQKFCEKYPLAKVEKDVFIVKNVYTNYNKSKVIDIEKFSVKSGSGYSIESEDISLINKDLTEQWYVSKSEKTSYSKEKIQGFYFPENFQSIVLPKKYSLMIGYTDCLIDTTQTKLKSDLETGDVDLPKDWQTLSFSKKEKLLDEMRGIRVVGGCSQDSRPREHAINIALLSAETYNWEVFLKAHLDIMNDRFDRMSDGSYAWGQRETYLKELEELNINVNDLIFGISFRVENPATNHYYSSISRVGRALSETSNPKEVEETILSIVSDEELDYFNRILFYFLFKNYNSYQIDETIKKANAERLNAALTTFPEHFKNDMIIK